MDSYHNDYVFEKLMQLRQSEIDREIRSGLNLRAIEHQKTTGSEKAEVQRGFWHKWFGSKRLSTSWK